MTSNGPNTGGDRRTGPRRWRGAMTAWQRPEMLNSSARRGAIQALEAAVARHEELRQSTARASTELFAQRSRAAREVVEHVEDYVNRLAHSPKEFDKSVEIYRIEVGRFNECIQRFQVEAAQATKVGRQLNRNRGSARRRRARRTRPLGRPGGGDDVRCGVDRHGNLRALRGGGDERRSRVARRRRPGRRRGWRCGGKRAAGARRSRRLDRRRRIAGGGSRVPAVPQCEACEGGHAAADGSGSRDSLARGGRV